MGAPADAAETRAVGTAADIPLCGHRRVIHTGRLRWFTSDRHLGHTNLIGYCDRPFVEVAEMDAAGPRDLPRLDSVP